MKELTAKELQNFLNENKNLFLLDSFREEYRRDLGVYFKGEGFDYKPNKGVYIVYSNDDYEFYEVYNGDPDGVKIVLDGYNLSIKDAKDDKLLLSVSVFFRASF